MIAAAETLDAPDWSQVPFDVTCSRCGRDLRGQIEPQCPDCTLEFEWSDLLPIAELLCPECHYNVWGLRDTRCPECGTRFEWDDIFAARYARRQPYFEYQWHKRPVRSFLSSAVRSISPARFWSRIEMHDRPSVHALFLFAAVAAMLAWTGLIMGLAIDRWIIIGRANRAIRLSNLGGHITSTLGSKDMWAMTLVVVTWIALSMAALFIFRQSMRMYKVRTAHVVRVWAYAVMTPLLWLLLAIYAWVFAWPFYRIPLEFLYSRWICRFVRDSGGFVLVVGVWLLTTCSIACAYKRYLKMDHPLGVAFASQIIALLATATLLAPCLLW